MTTPSNKKPILTPETQAFIDTLATQNAPPIYTLTPEAARKVLIDAQSQLKIKPSADVEDHVAPVRKTEKIDVRFVRPQGVTEKLPVIFYIHGGGWIPTPGSTRIMESRLRNPKPKSISAAVKVFKSKSRKRMSISAAAKEFRSRPREPKSKSAADRGFR